MALAALLQNKNVKPVDDFPLAGAFKESDETKQSERRAKPIVDALQKVAASLKSAIVGLKPSNIKAAIASNLGANKNDLQMNSALEKTDASEGDNKKSISEAQTKNKTSLIGSFWEGLKDGLKESRQDEEGGSKQKKEKDKDSYKKEQQKYNEYQKKSVTTLDNILKEIKILRLLTEKIAKVQYDPRLGVKGGSQFRSFETGRPVKMGVGAKELRQTITPKQSEKKVAPESKIITPASASTQAPVQTPQPTAKVPQEGADQEKQQGDTNISVDLPDRGKPKAPTSKGGGWWSKAKNLGRGILNVAKKPVVLAGVAAAGTAATVDWGVGKLGVGKDSEGNDLVVNEKQDEENWKKMSVGQKIQSGLARGIEKVGSFAFLGNMSQQARAARIQKETQYLNKPQTTNNTTNTQNNFLKSEYEKYQKEAQKRDKTLVLDKKVVEKAIGLNILPPQFYEYSAVHSWYNQVDLESAQNEKSDTSKLTNQQLPEENESKLAKKNLAVEQQAKKMGIDPNKARGKFEADVLTKIIDEETGREIPIELSKQDRDKVEGARAIRKMMDDSLNRTASLPKFNETQQTVSNTQPQTSVSIKSPISSNNLLGDTFNKSTTNNVFSKNISEYALFKQNPQAFKQYNEYKNSLYDKYIQDGMLEDEAQIEAKIVASEKFKDQFEEAGGMSQLQPNNVVPQATISSPSSQVGYEMNRMSVENADMQRTGSTPIVQPIISNNTSSVNTQSFVPIKASPRVESSFTRMQDRASFVY